MYDTVGYARSRLNDTVITHNSDPIHVIDIISTKGKMCVVALNLTSSSEVVVSLDECDITPVKLGYVNFNRRAFYSMRMPMRRDWRQGLRYVNLVDANGAHYNGIGYNTFVSTIKGIYPNFHNANMLLKADSCYEVAFHRDFSLDVSGNITYKGKINVAHYNDNDKSFTIHKDWIREALDEAIGA